MATFEVILIVLTVTTLMMGAIIPLGGYTSANVPNPWNDLTSGFGGQSLTLGSGTVSQTTNPQNVQHTAALQGCALGGLTGALVGAGVGAALGFGVGAIPGFVVGFLGFGAVGCAIGGGIGNYFPTGTTQLFNSIVSATGPIGGFLQGLVAAEQYVYPFIQFGIDWIPYVFALTQYEPAFGAILALFTSVTILCWLLEGAKLFRGIGITG